tara:strand:+ start:579 stop:716 length:138 start_codon:yes stop_codon:yes gene_type:complete
MSNKIKGFTLIELLVVVANKKNLGSGVYLPYKLDAKINPTLTKLN